MTALSDSLINTGAGALIALSGVIVTQVVSATIAKRNRQAALEDQLRDAVSEILVLQNRFELAQKNFFVASSDYWADSSGRCNTGGQ